MATYLRPGVFVEETLQPLTDPTADATDSIAAFVGTSAKGGPTTPTLVTSWSRFQALYGDIRNTTDDLAYGVYQFFNNGGGQCYVVRAVNTNAVAASLSLNDADSDGAGTDTAEATLTVTAKAAGTWASDPNSNSRVFVTVQAGQNAGRFDLIIEVGTGTTLLAREQFLDLTLDPADARYALSIVNSPASGSSYVTLTKVGVFGTDTSVGFNGNPAVLARTPLTGGSDGTGSPDLYAATQLLDSSVNSILDVNLPGVSDSTVLTNVINWAEARGDRFIVVDVPKPGPTDTAATAATAATTLGAALPKSSYAAVYGPWTYITDPAGGASGAQRLTAPGGAVLGQYSRTDATRGVQKAPAGVETALRVVNLTHTFSDTQLDTLNQANINVIRSLPGAGFCIFGARTQSVKTTDRYVNIRRSLMSIRRGLVSVTRFAVFEPNDELLWATLDSIAEQYLLGLYSLGVLRGSSQDQAFYVKCDSENNTDPGVAAGVVVIEVGVAVSSPAEFVVLRIGQFSGGSSVDENA